MFSKGLLSKLGEVCVAYTEGGAHRCSVLVEYRLHISGLSYKLLVTTAVHHGAACLRQDGSLPPEVGSVERCGGDGVAGERAGLRGAGHL